MVFCKLLLENLFHELQCGKFKYLELVDDTITSQQVAHYTNFPEQIIKYGFRNCISSSKYLETTRWCGSSKRSDFGWVFGFIPNSQSFHNAAGKYGNSIVYFEAPCIRVFHYGDQELQVVTHSSLINNVYPQLLKD